MGRSVLRPYVTLVMAKGFDGGRDYAEGFFRIDAAGVGGDVDVGADAGATPCGCG